MAKLTLLDMTQTILSSLDSDGVNSVGDTVESLQVASIIKNKYYDILTRADLPEQQVLYQLDPSLDFTKPTQMLVPEGAAKISWIKYFDSNPNNSQQVSQFGAFSHGLNIDLDDSSGWSTTSTTSNTIGLGTKVFTVASSTLPIIAGQSVTATSGINTMFGTVTSYVGTTLTINVISFTGSGTFNSWTITNNNALHNVPGYKYVTILPIDQFLDMINRFLPGDNNVRSFVFTEGGLNFTFYYKNDIQPQFCTVIENSFVIFDSYDSDFDTTLQASKTLVYGQKLTPFQMVDGFIPDMDDNQFPLLINEAKALAFFEMKQVPHSKAEQEVKRQWSAVQKNKSIAGKPTAFDALPNYGRTPRTGGYSSGGYGAYRWMRQSGP